MHCNMSGERPNRKTGVRQWQQHSSASCTSPADLSQLIDHALSGFRKDRYCAQAGDEEWSGIKSEVQE
jgi:hypothetical protein